MRQTLSIILMLVLFSCSLFSGNPVEIYFRLPLPTAEHMDKISRTISIAKYEEGWIYAYANESAFHKFTQLNSDYQILPHPSEGFFTHMAASIEEVREWDSYPTYDEYVEMMYLFSTEYPEICMIQNFGSSVNGRDLLFVKLSDNVGMDENEPEFMYSGQMHGNELIGFVTLLHLIDHLLENYGTDPQITMLLDEVEIWINPLANPDGTYFGGDETVSGAIRFNANGVDLNRNFPDFIDGPNPDGNTWQPENIAMMNFMADHHFVLSSNIHSGTEVVNYPWDTTPVLTADDNWWQIVSHTYADTVQSYGPVYYFDGYDDGITNGYAWYEADGTRQDYMTYFRHGREMTLELSNVQMLPEDQLSDHWDYNRASLINYIQECLYGIRGTITSVSGEPLDAVISIPGYDFDNSEVLTDPGSGQYYRLIAPGNYELLVESWGYLPLTVSDVTVSQDHPVIIDITLTPAPEVQVAGAVYDAETGQPLDGALAEFLQVPVDPVYSGPGGQFLFEDVYTGSYTLHIYSEGYNPVIEDVVINETPDSLVYYLNATDIAGFESGIISSDWQLEGDGDWWVDSEDSAEGLYSARSGDISDDQISSLSFTIDVAYPDEISFFCKVACEDDVNDNWDFLYFAIDGIEQERWDGLVDWHQESYPVDAGTHTFLWEYSKDGSVSHYSDAGWVDAIDFPASLDISEITPGDVNFDQSVDVLDIVLVVGMILNTIDPDYEQFIAADLDGDEIITVLDIVILINLITG